MAVKYTPKMERWLLEHINDHRTRNRGGFATEALFKAFEEAFPAYREGLATWRQWAQRIKHQHHVVLAPLPESPMDDIGDKVLDVVADCTLITSDWQIPYLDAKLANYAFKLAAEWGCDHHIINGDLYDFANLSKFDPSLHDYRLQAGEELQMGGDVVKESRRVFGAVTFIPGNHEWRLFLRRLSAQLSDDQVAGLLAPGDGVAYTPLSYVRLNGSIRVTHPASASVIPGSVARALSEKHHSNTIVAHGHGIGYARSYGGHYWCIESGGMFDPNRMDYAMVADKRRPMSNQGFVVVDGVTPYLIDAATLETGAADRWMYWAEAARKRREQAAEEEVSP